MEVRMIWPVFCSLVSALMKVQHKSRRMSRNFLVPCHPFHSGVPITHIPSSRRSISPLHALLPVSIFALLLIPCQTKALTENAAPFQSISHQRPAVVSAALCPYLVKNKRLTASPSCLIL